MVAIMAATKNPQDQKALAALATVQQLASTLTGGNIIKLINGLAKLKDRGLI